MGNNLLSSHLVMFILWQKLLKIELFLDFPKSSLSNDALLFQVLWMLLVKFEDFYISTHKKDGSKHFLLFLIPSIAHKQGLIKFFPKYETKDTRQKKVEILVSIFTHTKNQVLEVFKPRLPLPTNYCFKGNGKGRKRFYRDQSFSVCLFVFYLNVSLCF